MSNEQLNYMEQREYVFGGHRGVRVPYDDETEAVVVKEWMFKYLLSLIPTEPRKEEYSKELSMKQTDISAK